VGRASRQIISRYRPPVALDTSAKHPEALPDTESLLDQGAIASAIRGLKITIQVVDSIDSTNSELLRRAARADVHRHLLVAERQQAGRGRRGREWSALAGGSLTFSLGWRFERRAAQLGGLSLAAGVAVARALEGSGYRDLELKWPNDVLHRWRKLAGILIELTEDAVGSTIAVIGVGVNVRVPPSLRGKVAGPVTDLAGIDGDVSIDRNLLLACIAAELVTVLGHYAEKGFEPFRAEWPQRDALCGRPVQVLMPDASRILGVAAGVDTDGALLVERNARQLRFVNGEVSVRRA